MEENDLKTYRKQLSQNEFIQLKSLNDQVLRYSLLSNDQDKVTSLREKMFTTIAKQLKPGGLMNFFNLFKKNFETALSEIEKEIPIIDHALVSKKTVPNKNFSLFFCYEYGDLPALKRISDTFLSLSIKTLSLNALNDEIVLANQMKSDGFSKIFLFLVINKACDKNEWLNRIAFLNEITSIFFLFLL